MLYDVIYATYRGLYKVRELPAFLRFRLINIGARRLHYDDFAYYFNLKDQYEALKFIIDDNNMEEIMRYSLGNQDMHGLKDVKINVEYLKGEDSEFKKKK